MLNRDFNVVQQNGKSVLEIFLYGDIQGDYFNFWGERITSKTSAGYVQRAIEQNPNASEINVYINSCGGSVMEGIAIHNLLKRQDKPVTAYVDAFAYSVASVIAMAADKVIMPSNTTMFIHHAAWWTFGNPDELRKSADDLAVIDEASNNSYLSKAGEKLSAEKLKELLDNETFLTAEQCLEYGLCDEVINPIDIGDSKSVVEQFARNSQQKNSTEMKAVKKAAELIGEEIANPSEEVKPLQNKENKDSGFNWLSELFKNTKF
ncbi:MAG: Clp protease ClpP [Ruminococcus sp.]|nr:Clp protease ClpP [Ruminococcus sp.]